MEPGPENQVPAAREPRASRRLLLAGLCILAAFAIAGTLLVASKRQRQVRETAAIKELESLGALVVKDAGGVHAASINLSTITSSDNFAQAINHLSALGELGSLDASRTALDDSHLAIVGKLSSLKSLVLSDTKVTDAGLEHIRQLSGLGAIYLVSTAVTDRGTPAFASLSQLKIVDLSSTKVTQDLAAIATLPNLEWLVLRNLKLADDALPQLAQCRTLRRLSLEDTVYSDASVAALRKAAPNLTIDP